MTIWYENKVRYEKIDENSGKNKVVNELFLIDAVSFTDSESRLVKEMGNYISGEYSIESIKKTKIEEVQFFDLDGNFFLCKIEFIHSDEKTGKIKKHISQIIIIASNIEQARNRCENCLESVVIPYSIKSISETKIIDVFKYNN